MSTDNKTEKQNPLTVAPHAAVIMFRQLLIAIKKADGKLNFDEVCESFLAAEKTSLGISNPDSMFLVKTIVAEVRELDA